MIFVVVLSASMSHHFLIHKVHKVGTYILMYLDASLAQVLGYVLAPIQRPVLVTEVSALIRNLKSAQTLGFSPCLSDLHLRVCKDSLYL